MRKGKRVSIQIEHVGTGGVISSITMTAIVLMNNGGTITVRGEDGYLYEIDSNTRDSGTGAYPVASY